MFFVWSARAADGGSDEASRATGACDAGTPRGEIAFAQKSDRSNFEANMRKALLLVSPIVLVALAAPALAMTDKAFLDYAIQGDNSEAAIGYLAGDKAASQEARTVGKTIAGDHEKARIEAVKLADLRGLTSPKTPSPDGAAEAEKLKGLSGAAFDKEFAAFLVKDHEKTIAAFKAEAHSGEGPVAKYAEMSLPMLEKHLDMAEKLQQQESAAAK
jgi:putative membrane protein